MLHEARGLKVVSGDAAGLQGSPIGSLKGIEEFIQSRSEQLWLLGDRLHLLHSHDAFYPFALHPSIPWSLQHCTSLLAMTSSDPS